jgi:2-oxo-3-hexenedioate decarboxylase
MYATTPRPPAAAAFDLGPLLEPRIEPEIAFGLARPPAAGMDEAASLGCIDWVAHGFEIVQSIFPDRRFAGADTVAGFGLHGAYLLGSCQPLRDDPETDRLAGLSTFQIALARDGVEIDRGSAANVLGGPLSALRHLVELLAKDPANPPLVAGEIVTTGTLARAFQSPPGKAGARASPEFRSPASPSASRDQLRRRFSAPDQPEIQLQAIQPSTTASNAATTGISRRANPVQRSCAAPPR